MTTKVEMWKSATGAIHETEHAALCDDLVNVLTSTDAINEASARQAVAFLTVGTERLKSLRDLIGRVADTAPANPVAQPVPFDGAPNIDRLTNLDPYSPPDFARIGTNDGYRHVWSEELMRFV